VQTATRDLAWQFGRGYRQALTTTNPTTVTPAIPVGGRHRMVLLLGSVAVTTAATNLTVTVTYTDPDAGQQTKTVLNGVSEPVGATGFVGGPFLCAAGTTVQVTATAGTENQATVSVTLVGA